MFTYAVTFETFERPLARPVSQGIPEAFDPRLTGRGAGPAKVLAITPIAMSSRVDPAVICGPLSDTGSGIGRFSSLAPRSASPGWRRSTLSSKSSISRATVNPTSTWVEVHSSQPR